MTLISSQRPRKPDDSGVPDFQLPMAEFEAMTVGTVLVLFPQSLCVERLDNRMQRRHLINTQSVALADIAKVSLEEWAGTSACTLVIQEHGPQRHEIVMKRPEAERAHRVITASLPAPAK